MLLFQLLRAPLGSRLVWTELNGLTLILGIEITNPNACCTACGHGSWRVHSRYTRCHAETLILGIAITNPNACCPACGHGSWRVHSRYTRCHAEEPVFGHRVRLQIMVRRFFCMESGCPRRIFVEPLGDSAARHARTTTRLARTHLAVGYALGGEAGARLAEKTAVPTSPDTLLRRVKKAGARSFPAPRLIGIDGWAWCKGQRYGTIVVDLETGDVIDLLPDRDAATVKAWLQAHPGVELISRDRSSSYAQAATEGAHDAQQVADRWHLLKNVREAIERLLERNVAVITQALKPADLTSESQVDALPGGAPEFVTSTHPPCQESPSIAAPDSLQRQTELAKRQRRVEQFERAHELHRQGETIRQIARDLGMSRKAVRRYLRREQCPDWRPGRTTRSEMDPYREWIDGRITEGQINASKLHRELASRGVRLSYGTVRRFLTKRLGQAGITRLRANAAKPKPHPPPSPKQLSFDWVRRPENRTVEAQARLDTIRAASPELTVALELADEFVSLIRKHSTGSLQEWLPRAEMSNCPEIRRFAEGIRRDESAVNAAVTLRWSNGPVEGHVNRLKSIKRQMYGRAGFSLLKARVLSVA